MVHLRRIFCFAIVMVLCFSGTLFGQVLPTGLGGFSSFLPELPGIQDSLGNVTFNPYAQVGYTHVGTNMNIPIGAELAVPPGGGSGLQIGELDLYFEDLNVWTGTLGLNAILTPKISAFVMAVGASPRLLPASGTVPVSTARGGILARLTFTASDLEIWAFQAGMGYSVSPGFSFIGGFYLDHTSVALEDPRSGAVPLANQTLRGDLVAKTRIPFGGVQIQQSNYVGILSYSPFAFADVKFALRNSQNSIQDLRYSWNTPGQYLSVYFQYNATPPPAIVSLWFTGSWMHVRGSGQLEFESRTGAPPPPNVSREKDSTAILGKYTLGGGISVGVMF